MGDSLIIATVEENRYGECTDFLFKEFFPRESLAMSSGLDKEPDFKFGEQMKEWLREDISFIAIDSSTDQIVGICLNYILEKRQSNSSPTDESSSVGPTLNRIFSFLSHLEEGYDAYEQLGAQRGMELLFLCVKEGYGGRGIARKLTENAIELARTKQLEFIQSNPTTGATRHLFEVLGFETISEMKLVDFTINGKPGFPFASDQDITRFVVKKL